MKRILSKYWLVLFIAVLIAWPAIVISMQRVDRPDEATLDKLVKQIEERLRLKEKTIAPPQPKLEWESDEKHLNYIREIQIVFNELLPIAAGDALNGKLRQAEEIYSPLIQYYDSLTSETISQDWRFSERYNLAKIQRALAQRAILTKDWDEALRRIYSTANIGNSGREQSLLGMFSAKATRLNAYEGYNHLLHAGAPIEVERAALEQLIRLRDTEPQLNENVRFSQTLSTLKHIRQTIKESDNSKLLQQKQSETFPLQMWVMDVIATLERSYNKQQLHIEDPVLKRWIARRSENPSIKRNEIGFQDRRAVWNWTDLPASERWLRSVFEKERVFNQKFLDPVMADYKDADPWRLALVQSLEFTHDLTYLEATTRCKVTATRGRLLEAAYAAKIHQRETGQWPDSEALKEMIPALPEGVFAPIQIAEKKMTADLQSALWESVLPTNLQGVWLKPQDLATGQWFATLTEKIDEARLRTAEALALKQILEQHPRLAEDVRVIANSLLIPAPDSKEIRSIEEIENWEPATAPAAPALPTPTPTPAPAPAGPYGYGGYGGYASAKTSAPQSAERIVELRFSASIRAPERAWILWSPGPDRTDDGGAIQYDPTNGTISKGDLIVFPEEF